MKVGEITLQRGLLWLLLALYAWFEGGSRTFTMPATILVGIAVAFFLGFGLVVSVPKGPLRTARNIVERKVSKPLQPVHLSSNDLSNNPRAPTLKRMTFVTWSLLVLAIIILELIELFQLPRRTHPTISSLIVPLLAHSHLFHSLAFLAWVIAAWWMVKDWAQT